MENMFEQKPNNAQERKMQERLHMRKVYSNLTSLESAVQYMKSEDFEKGGWFLLAFQAMEIKKLKEDIGYIKNKLDNLSVVIRRDNPDDVLVHERIPNKIQVFTEKKDVDSEEPWVTVADAAWALQIEAIEGKFNLVFNPHYLVEWIRTDRDNILAGTYRRHPEYNIRYQIKQEAFLEKLLVYRKSRRTKKINKFDNAELERFIESRKKPLPGMCA